MKKEALVSKERQVNTYAEMWHGSRVLLYKGQEDKKGSHWEFMASITFTAFTLEAYLNHLGAKLYECWEDIESLSPLKKLRLLCERLGLEPNYARRPYQTVKQLFTFRNEIAHGKTVKLASEDQIRFVDDKLKVYLQKPLETKWQKYSTERNAIRAREDVEEIIRELHKKAGIEDDPVFFPGMAFGSLSLLSQERNP